MIYCYIKSSIKGKTKEMMQPMCNSRRFEEHIFMNWEFKPHLLTNNQTLKNLVFIDLLQKF